jgi:hypothetical protein
MQDLLKHGLREFPYKSDNVIHFQDPRSANYTGRLMRPLIKTKNERNYTSFNFIKPASAKEENVRFVRRVKKEIYTNITDMHSLIHA